MYNSNIKLKQLFLINGLILLYSSVFAINLVIPEYDNESITPATWKEVDLTYTTYVDGEKCIQTANILRPITWLNNRNLNESNVGQYIRLTKGDIGVDTEVKLVAIKPVKFSFDEKDAAKSTRRPVIGTFKRCSNNVTDYTFKDIKIGKLETIGATPEHPFYSLDRYDYIPIGLVAKNEKIKTGNCGSVKLIASRPHDGKKEYVFNFEVVGAHNYLAGNSQMLVHNTCPTSVQEIRQNAVQHLGSGSYGDAYLHNLGTAENPRYWVYKIPHDFAFIYPEYTSPARTSRLWNEFYTHGHDGIFERLARAEAVTLSDGVTVLKTPFIQENTLHGFNNRQLGRYKAKLTREFKKLDRYMADNDVSGNLKLIQEGDDWYMLPVDFDKVFSYDMAMSPASTTYNIRVYNQNWPGIADRNGFPNNLKHVVLPSDRWWSIGWDIQDMHSLLDNPPPWSFTK